MKRIAGLHPDRGITVVRLMTGLVGGILLLLGVAALDRLWWEREEVGNG